MHDEIEQICPKDHFLRIICYSLFLSAQHTNEQISPEFMQRGQYLILYSLINYFHISGIGPLKSSLSVDMLDMFEKTNSELISSPRFALNQSEQSGFFFRFNIR